jgi:hypothetical protein
MIVDQRRYTLKPGSLPQYVAAYEEQALAVQREILGNLLGFFVVETGELNQIVHFWGYDSFEERARRRAELRRDASWQRFGEVAFPSIVKQECQLLIPTSFSPIR